MSYSGFFPKIIKMPHLDVESYVVPSNGGQIRVHAHSDHDSFSSEWLDDDMLPDDYTETPTILKEKELEEKERQVQEILQDTQQEAERILMESRMEAAQILNEAQQKVTMLEESAYEQGFQMGEAAGQESVTAALNQAQSVLKAALTSRNEILANSESEVLDLVFMIARKVIKSELQTNSTIIVNVVKDALKRLGEQVEVHVHVHPADVPTLHQHLGQLKELVLDIVIEPDSDISQGGCVIHSRAGSIDSQIETQFENIEKSLLAVNDSV